jgi:argininosuccinate lyase
MKKLWQKNWELDSFIESFETKDDIVCDQKLTEYDVYASIAHAKMLKKIGILSQTELASLQIGLLKILDLSQNNAFTLTMGDEDIHTKIENYLTEKCGKVGKKIHTGRSRNDQSLTALRLFAKQQLLVLWGNVLDLTESFYSFAKEHENVAMPGYTHMQKAMPSSVGMWAGSFTEAFLDDLQLLKSAYSINNQSPLGSAAGYGVPLPIDREYTSQLLGFAKVQTNPIYCQNSRGKIEAVIITAINSILLDINKFATDILLFTTSELQYFSISEKLLSGSSIMPQKKNVDIAELLRSKIHMTLGNYVQIVSLSSNLSSGYNRDFQDNKKVFMESIEIGEDCLKVTNMLMQNITPIKENLERALTPEIFATHKALELVSQGMPFREAYQTVATNILQTNINPTPFLNKSKHLGGTGNLGLDKYQKQLEDEKKKFEKEQQAFKQIIKNLIG